MSDSDLIAGIPRELLSKKSLILDGLDKAIVGFTDPGILVYSYKKLVDRFTEDGMSRNEAYEWVDSQILGLQCNGDGFSVLYEC